MAIAYKTFKTFSLLLPSFIIIIFFSSRTHCISDAEALLKFKSSLSNTEALSSWDPNTTPCKGKTSLWNGVICFEGIVIGLRLKSMDLSGTIDVNSLANLPGLRTISLEDNKFTGPMPELDHLGALKAIYLSKNNFSGPIPQDFFSKLESLKKLWLSNNSFTGDIPISLAKLRHLVELHLENNQFSGMVPPFKQPPLVSLDLSNNKLKGEIPMSLANFKETSFGGNVDLCGDVIGKQCTAVVNEDQTPPPQPTPEQTPMIPPEKSPQRLEARKRRRFMGRVAIIVSAILVVLSLVIIGMLVARKRRKDQENIPTTTTTSKQSNAGDEGSVADVGPTSFAGGSSSSKRSSKGSAKGGAGVVGDLTMVNNDKGAFGMADLMKASAEVLGNGSIMGSAYKAIMANGLGVVVKRMREMNRLEIDAFDVELKRLATLRHKNVLPPLAYHYRKEEKLVVYEYVPKGSLHYILHGDRGKSHEELNWTTRLKIIKGITEGLSYLHTELKSYDVPHGNLKSSNILMSLGNDPLLSDYGFDPLTNPSLAGQALFGYRAPEAIQDIKISHKCDVYCLGVVILEIVTCKFPSQYLSSTKGGTDVVQWVASAIDEGREADLIDPDIDSHSASSKASMVKMLHIGATCTENNPDQRPNLSQVKERIDRIEVHDGSGRDSRTIDVLPST